MKVAIQGVKASFHEVAARAYYPGELQLAECASFKLLGDTLRSGRVDSAVMAIENSIAGSILPNYSLLEKNGFKILGETYLRIEMSCMALPGQKLEDLRFAQSHPMALLQCEEFLAAHPGMKVLEAADTAESAKDIREKNLRGHAAIAHRLAAEIYGLELLAVGIESNKQNYTRFLTICRQEDHVAGEQANKASIRFEAAHRPGALARVLGAFSDHSVNMTKIQSVPIPGKPYEYSFHVDLEWDRADHYRAAMAKVKNEVLNLIHFGEYPRSERPAL